MSQIIDLGKLRFHFAGDYNNATSYEANDIVKYGGNVYVYTYSLKASGNLPTDAQYWMLMVEGFNFEGVYDNTVEYQVGDGVSHGGKVYIAIADTTGNTPPNPTYWSQFADGIQWEGEFNSLSAYQKNDVVLYGGSAYIALQDTTGNLPSDPTYWERFVEGIGVEGVYNDATEYVLNDVVAYGGNLYRALGDTVGNLPTDSNNWELYLSGIKLVGEYSPSVDYAPNDIVTYGGALLYRATTETVGNPPTDTNYWESYQPGINPRGEWSSATQYYPGDVVSYGGNTFRALLTHASAVFATDLASGSWEKFNGGVRWRGDWSTGNQYIVDDIVKNGVSSYICLEDHTSVGPFQSDLDASRWQLFAVGGDYVLPTTSGNEGKFISSDGNNYVWAIPNTTTLKFFQNQISEDLEWSTGGMRFTHQTLTISSGSTYTISNNGIHHVITEPLVFLTES